MIPTLRFNRFLQKYFYKIKRRHKLTKKTIEIALRETLNDFVRLFSIKSTDQLQGELVFLFKDILGQGAWISRSLARSLLVYFELPTDEPSFFRNPNHSKIVHRVASDLSLEDLDVSYGDVFNAVFNELCYKADHSDYETKLSCQKLDTTIVLVDGVMNELYKLAAFERALRIISNKTNLKYFIPSVHGLKDTDYNQEEISHQLKEYVKHNPGEKLWLVGFSKGGLDVLHFVASNSDFSNQHVLGVSTIASPLLGSPKIHTNPLRFIKFFERFKKSSVYKAIDRGNDILGYKLQDSLSPEKQGKWFLENHKQLPSNLFYTSLALYCPWIDSHVYMMLTKILFQSESFNDGVVDIEDAFFPEYFDAINFGIIRGHHLIGSRSSTFNQEALIESLIIVLKYFKKLK